MQRSTARFYLLVSLCIVSFSVSSYAATVVLKSGETIKGKILQRSDTYIKVDFYGVPLTYYFDEILSIDTQGDTDEKVSHPSPEAIGVSEETVVPYRQRRGGATWNEWVQGITEYFDRIELLQKKGKEIASLSASKLKEAMERDDGAESTIIILEVGEQLASLINQLNATIPPPDFSTYHRMITESYVYKRMANDAILKNEKDSAKGYQRLALSAEKEAAIESKRVFMLHGAPQRIIDGLDLMIARYENL